jgi:hypothetical protein
MRHDLARIRQGREGEWIIAATGTVISLIFSEKRLSHVAVKKAWEATFFKTAIRKEREAL